MSATGSTSLKRAPKTLFDFRLLLTISSPSFWHCILVLTSVCSRRHIVLLFYLMSCRSRHNLHGANATNRVRNQHTHVTVHTRRNARPMSGACPLAPCVFVAPYVFVAPCIFVGLFYGDDIQDFTLPYSKCRYQQGEMCSVHAGLDCDGLGGTLKVSIVFIFFSCFTNSCTEAATPSLPHPSFRDAAPPHRRIGARANQPIHTEHPTRRKFVLLAHDPYPSLSRLTLCCLELVDTTIIPLAYWMPTPTANS